MVLRRLFLWYLDDSSYAEAVGDSFYQDPPADAPWYLDGSFYGTGTTLPMLKRLGFVHQDPPADALWYLDNSSYAEAVGDSIYQDPLADALWYLDDSFYGAWTTLSVLKRLGIRFIKTRQLMPLEGRIYNTTGSGNCVK